MYILNQSSKTYIQKYYKSILFVSLTLAFTSAAILSHVSYASTSNTRVDAWGTLEVAGTDSANVGGNGVDVYSNGPSAFYSPNKPNNTVGGVTSGEKWQCVELINRLYLTKGWTTANWQGNGNEIYARAPAGLVKEANGSITNLKAGDVISEDYGVNGAGHTAIVSSVNGNTVTLINQNTGPVYSTGTLSNGSLTLSWTGYTTIGVVHSPTSVAATPPAPTTPVPWTFTNLEGDGGAVSQYNADVGITPVSVNYGGSLQSFWYDQTNGRLRHAWSSNGTSWLFETLDGPGAAGGNGRTSNSVGRGASVAVVGGQLQLYYYNLINHTLRHAWTDATGWHFETLDTSGDVGYVSTVLGTSSSGVQLFYPNLSNGNLRHAWTDATGWHFENLDGSAGSLAGTQGNYGTNVGGSLSSASDPSGNIQLFYYDASRKLLKHSWTNATGWHFENLDGGTVGTISGGHDDIGINSSVTYNGSTLQLFSYNATGAALRHAWSDAGGWHFENLDGVVSNGPFKYDVGLFSSATVAGGNLQVMYYGNKWGELRHAWSDAGGWHFENLDGLGGSPTGRQGPNVILGKYPSVQYFNNSIRVMYYDVANRNMRYSYSN